MLKNHKLKVLIKPQYHTLRFKLPKYHTKNCPNPHNPNPQCPSPGMGQEVGGGGGGSRRLAQKQKASDFRESVVFP